MAPGSGYLSVKPGVKVKVLYIGSADEEGCPAELVECKWTE
jgi:hypothetical protein